MNYTFKFSHPQTQNVLDALHSAGITSAIAAGGIVRDVLFGKTPKDIDIFISHDEVNKLKETGISERLGGTLECLFSSEYSAIPDVHSIYNLQQELPIDWRALKEEVIQQLKDFIPSGELPVQIIVIENGMTPRERLDTFDFGFCQVGYDGKEVVYTDHFLRDFQNETVTLVFCENEKEFKRSMKRYDRLKDKFPELTMINTFHTHISNPFTGISLQ